MTMTAIKPEVETTTIGVFAALDLNEPAKIVRLREPDMYDEGKAFWLTDQAVVSTDIERVEHVSEILRNAPRLKTWDLGWVRLHPNHYGIEVDSYFDHGRGAEPVPAQVAWEVALDAVTR